MLTFNLKRKWFDLIASGEKNVEFREVKPYWTKRLGCLSCGDTIAFRCGYKPGNDIRAVVNYIDKGPCPYEGFNGLYYRIVFQKY